MRILFVTGCLAAGRDGVGDYTRGLAQECVRRGHECRLLALHDGFVYGVRQEEDALFGRTLRLGRNMPWPERTRVARGFVKEFDPSWVSVQMVPYGFHPRGLHLQLAEHLSRLCDGFQVQLMFHELWFGAEQGASLRQRVVGLVQRELMLRVIRQTRARVVQTSNETYVQLLQTQGVPATRLPMFGALPVLASSAARQPDDWFATQLQQAGIPVSPANRSHYWIVGLVGALPPVWPPEPLLTRLHDAALESHKQLVLVSAGRIGPGESVWSSITETYGSRFHCCRLGEQSPGNLSRFLGGLDFGIATTPWSLLGKSASVAAMLDHGLPVIVNRDEVTFPAIAPAVNDHDPLLIKMDPVLALRLSAAQRLTPAPRLGHAADIFMAALNSNGIAISGTEPSHCVDPLQAATS